MPALLYSHGRPGWEGVTTTKRLAGLLHPRDCSKSRPRRGSKRPYVYGLESTTLADLATRYGARLKGGSPP